MITKGFPQRVHHFFRRNSTDITKLGAHIEACMVDFSCILAIPCTQNTEILEKILNARNDPKRLTTSSKRQLILSKPGFLRKNDWYTLNIVRFTIPSYESLFRRMIHYSIMWFTIPSYGSQFRRMIHWYIMWFTIPSCDSLLHRKIHISIVWFTVPSCDSQIQHMIH